MQCFALAMQTNSLGKNLLLMQNTGAVHLKFTRLGGEGGASPPLPLIMFTFGNNFLDSLPIQHLLA